MWFPSWLRWYKKPEYRDIKEYSNAVVSGKRSPSPDGRGKTAIPSRLKLERVLENKTCSPMSLYDFYMYLKYIEFSSENLEFLMWFRNYEANWAKTASFESLQETDTEPLCDDKEAESPSSPDVEANKRTIHRISQLISNQACGPCANPNNKGPSFCPFPNPDQDASAHNMTADFSSLGRHAEIRSIIATFLQPGAPKELNIPPLMRATALAALSSSSDPAALRPVADHVYLLLRNCSHRNFVRLGVSNGTFETVCVATSLGIVLTAAGLLFALLRACVPFVGAHSRFDVLGVWPFWFLGIALVLSGLRGSCFFLLLFSRRQPLPWERFDDDASVTSKRSQGVLRLFSRLMIFDRKLIVQDAHLRRLQRKIVVQSLVGGAVAATLGVLVFIFLPVWTQTARL